MKGINLIELNAYGNTKITNINHMTRMRKLNAGGLCGITDEGIKDLKLVKLYYM